MPFTSVNDGELAIAPSVQQLIDALQGVTGAGQAISLTSLQSTSSPALALQNLDATYGWALKVYNHSGASLLDIRDASTSFDNGTLSIDNAAHTVTLNSTLNQRGPLKVYNTSGASLLDIRDAYTSFDNGTLYIDNVAHTVTLGGVSLTSSGPTFDLDDYSGGVVINTATGLEASGSLKTATNAAWTAAFAAVTAAGGGTIALGPGSYLCPQSGLTWPNYLTIAGVGMGATTIKHRVSSLAEMLVNPILAFGVHHFTGVDFTIDGNDATIAAQGANAASRGSGSEVTLEPLFASTGATTFTVTGGYDNMLLRVEVKNFHDNAIAMGGKRNSVLYCHVQGNPVATYVSWAGGANLNAGGSLYGITGTSFVESTDLVVHGNRIHGLRMPAIFVGGRRAIVTANQVWDCHRDVDSSGSPGGAIANAPSWTGVSVATTGPTCFPDVATATSAGYLRTTGMVIADNSIGGRHSHLTGLPDYGSLGVAPSTGRSYDNGIDVDQTDSVVIANNMIEGVSGAGIGAYSSAGGGTLGVQISGGVISKLWRDTSLASAGGSTALIISAAAGNNVGASIANVTVKNCSNALYTGGNLSTYGLDGIMMHDCKRGWENAVPAVVSWTSGANSRAYDSSGIGTYTTSALPFRSGSNAKMALGLTLNQGAADDEILSLKSSDVAHGITTITETNTYGLFDKVNAVTGGLRISGAVAGSEIGVQLRSMVGLTTAVRDQGALAPITLDASLKSGTTIGSVGGDKNMFVIRDTGVTRFIVDSDGDVHADAGGGAVNSGTGYIVYDEYEDAELVRALDIERRGPGLIETEFDRLLRYGRADLEAAKLATFNDHEGGDGTVFVNYSALTRLLSGAVWQQHQRVSRLEARLAQAEAHLGLGGVLEALPAGASARRQHGSDCRPWSSDCCGSIDG